MTQSNQINVGYNAPLLFPRFNLLFSALFLNGKPRRMELERIKPKVQRPNPLSSPAQTVLSRIGYQQYQVRRRFNCWRKFECFGAVLEVRALFWVACWNGIDACVINGL
jgi:hypothetical protein